MLLLPVAFQLLPLSSLIAALRPVPAFPLLFRHNYLYLKKQNKHDLIFKALFFLINRPKRDWTTIYDKAPLRSKCNQNLFVTCTQPLNHERTDTAVWLFNRPIKCAHGWTVSKSAVLCTKETHCCQLFMSINNRRDNTSMTNIVFLFLHD